MLGTKSGYWFHFSLHQIQLLVPDLFDDSHSTASPSFLNLSDRPTIDLIVDEIQRTSSEPGQLQMRDTSSKWLAKRVGFVLSLHLLLGGSCWAQTDDVYDVGAAVVDITPHYPIRLNGFGFRRKESEGVSQRIHARALAVSQSGQPPLVLVTLDSLGVRMAMVDEVGQRLKQSHNLPRRNLAVTFPHSHCTPKVNGAFDNIFSSAIRVNHRKHIDRQNGW